MNRQLVARELMLAAEELAGLDVGSRTAGIEEDLKAAALKGKVDKYLQLVKQFRGSTNKLLEEVSRMVDRPASLAQMAPIRDVIILNQTLKKTVLPHTFLSDAELMSMAQLVMCKDAGTC